ncbi:MAG: phage portal protein [Oscillospiraceae bacterium]|nr:phage portal protein [Oscillospiraceae bacterium]
MGLFNKLFKDKEEREMHDYFETLSNYTPVFTTFEGGVYEMELTRAAIHSFAYACSKLNPEITGSAGQRLKNILSFSPNPFMDTTKFIYRTATSLEVKNNSFITPIFDELDGRITGYFPIYPLNTEVVESNNIPYYRFTFATGKRVAIEVSKVGHLTKFQFQDDFFGSDNSPLKPTMDLIHTQNEGIQNAVKNTADLKYIARVPGSLPDDKLKKLRKRIAKMNFTNKNKSNILLYDGQLADLKPIDIKPFTINAVQMKQIQENVFHYFGTNESILQNKFTEDEWHAYYQGSIEPFAIQLSLVMTNMTFSPMEIAHNNKIHFTTNRLQNLSPKSKMEFSTSLIDRGVVVPNEARKLWGLEPLEGGDERILRRDYVSALMMDMRDLEIQKQIAGLLPKTETGKEETNGDTDDDKTT